MPEGTFAVRGLMNNRVRIEPTEIEAQGGPIYGRLSVLLHLDLNPGGPQQNQKFTTLAAECGLFLADYALKISDAMANVNLVSVQYPGISMVWKLDFPLDPFRVKALEAKRRGDLKLRFDLAFILALLDRHVISERSGEGAIEFVVGFERSMSQLYVEVPQSHWAGKILPGLGADQYFIVEFPTRTEHIAAAWALIKSAEAAFDRWDTKAVFAHCREAESALNDVVAKIHAGNSFLTQERWKRASKEFNHFASLDLHLEEIRAKSVYSKDQVQIGKSDAECLLIFVKALAKYAEELIRLEAQSIVAVAKPANA